MNIIDAIFNLVNNPITKLQEVYKSNNRANSMGDALEEYVKDLFAGTFSEKDEVKRMKQFSDTFSYLGNNSNPPDAMLKGGDAIEVKKIESKNSALALNSSYPKQKLLRNSTMISADCRSCEDWLEKDMIYIVGWCEKSQLRSLCMVYGLDYCAKDEVYSGLKNKLTNVLHTTPGIDFTESKELGHINNIDPLGITYMRIRGMFGIENPWKVFSYIYKRNLEKSFNFMCLINEDKWNSLGNVEKIENLDIEEFKIQNVIIKNPDNPAKLVNAKLITFYR